MIRTRSTIARFLAPDDLKQGQYVAIHQVYVHPCFCAPDESPRWEPSWDRDPRRVKAVCVPYVFVEKPDGSHETLDLRRARVVRLDGAYGHVAFEALREDAARAKASSDSD